MLTGLPREEKKAKLREMKWTLKLHGIRYRNEPRHIEKMYRRLAAALGHELVRNQNGTLEVKSK